MTVIPQTTFQVLESGEYQAFVNEVKAVDGQFGPQLRWSFSLTDVDDGSVTAWTSQVFSPRSKLYSWVRACFEGKEIPAGWPLDTNKLPGRPVRLILTVEQGKDGPYNKVSELLPPRKSIGSAPAARAAAPPPPDPARDWLDDDSGDVPF